MWWSETPYRLGINAGLNFQQTALDVIVRDDAICRKPFSQPCVCR